LRRSVEPKPYALVPVPEEEPKRINVGDRPHDKFFGYAGRLVFTLEVVSEWLFVGSGDYDFNGERVWHKFFRKDGVPAIPGTSVKGAVRSVAEAISNSCLSHVDKKLIRTILEAIKNSSHKPCRGETLCPACRIFGSVGYKGRVSFFDATPLGNLKLEKVQVGELWSPSVNITNTIDKWSRKFYKAGRFRNPEGSRNVRLVEAAPKGSKFNGAVAFQSLSKDELGLLLTAMGVNQNWSFVLKLGGAKPRCLGAAKLEVKRIDSFVDYSRLSMGELVDAFLVPLTLHGESLKAFLKDCFSSRELLHEKSFQKFLEVYGFKEGECPQGLY